MSTIQDAYWNALLADATYALNANVDNVVGGGLVSLLQTRMTEPVATSIASNFTLVTHIDSNDTFGSGFDATVWRRTDGKLFVSMTGSEGPQDFLSDVQLTLTGNASAQVIAMVNWWFKISTPAGQPARQIGIAQVGMASVLVEAASVTGTGQVSAADIAGGIEVNGHSLGGYLASAFTRLLGEQANVTHTTTFNSAGFAFGSESVFQQYESVLGAGYGLGRFPNSSEQTNYFSANGINVATNTFWFSQVGQRISLFNEEGTGFPNHYMYKLTDSLSLIAAMAKLDPTLTISTANALLSSSANQTQASYEGALDGLRRLLISTGVSATSIGDVSGSQSSRLSYQINLQSLINSTAFTELAGKLHISASSSALTSEAKTDFSALMALQTLSPVVLRGSNPSNQTLLDSTLGGVTSNAGFYAQWQADQVLSAADRAAGKANFTDSWLADRATLLSMLVQQNISDSTSSLSTTLSGGIATTYLDVTTSQQVITGNGTARRISFGGSANDSLNGGSGDDHLYGGAGSDNLWGGSGNDYMEGGDDVDALYGEAGDDTLVDGAGNDVLTSGSGRDVLNGGAGFDAYWISAGERAATILDSDGSGSIVIEKADLSSYTLGSNIHQVIGSPSYYEDDQHNRYVLRGNDLVVQIKEGGQSITIKDFQSMSGSKLGIDLQGPTASAASLPMPTEFGLSLVGTEENNHLNPVLVSEEGIFYNWTSVETLGGDDLINIGWQDLYWFRNDGSGLWALVENLVCDAGAGDDVAVLEAYYVWSSGGTGNDVLIATGASTVMGGAGSDIISGNTVEQGFYSTPAINELGDRLFADMEMSREVAIAVGNSAANDAALGDFIAAENTNDLLVGGNARDVLAGGAGRDELIAGAGDDLIFGDRSYVVDIPNAYVPGTLQWDFTTTHTNVNGSVQLNYAVTSFVQTWAGTTHSPVLTGIDMPGDADTVYAGNGNDSVLAGEGDDFIDAGAGDDIAFGEQGNDTLLGQAGNDLLMGDVLGEAGGQDFLDGGEGNDKLWAGGGADLLYGGAGDDMLYGDDENQFDGDDYLNGEDGNDILTGSGGAETLIGGAGVDSLYGDSTTTADSRQGDDYLDGGAGNDLLVGWGGSDILLGGDGNDRLFGDGSTVSVAKQGSDYLDGGAGDDVLSGDGGADTLIGGIGDDSLYGDASDTPDAIQGDDYLDGGKGNDVLAGWGGSDTLMGGDGDDLLDGDGATVSVAKQGDDYLDGGNGNDSLLGEGGNDVLVGGMGNDLLQGGDGNDTYKFGPGDGYDKIIDTAGNDTILLGAGSSPDDTRLYRHSDSTTDDLVLVIADGHTQLRVSNYFGAASSQIEQISFADGTVWDSAAIAARVINLTGTTNTQTGTTANDTFTVDNVNDVIAEQADGGTDTVLSTVSYSLPSNVENLTLQGVLNINAYGNGLANTLIGNSSDNTLIGYAGADTLIGGAGDDTYYVGAEDVGEYSVDAVIENEGEGYDTQIASTFSSVLAPNVERLVGTSTPNSFIANYQPTSSAQKRYWVGNALDNTIDLTGITNGYGGFTNSNYIDGGVGADLMLGSKTGNDIYVVDNVGDVVVEGGIYGDGGQISKKDTVEASISYVLPDNVENLVLTGSLAISGTGNALNNDIDGSINSSANVLSGGVGNDIYRVDAGDTVVEAVGEGFDTVLISAGAVSTYTFDAFANVEKLQLANGMGASSIQGNSFNNSIFGNTSNNVLQGGAGDDVLLDNGDYTVTASDVDVLIGGDGNDTLTSMGGYDTLDGGAGDDILTQTSGTSSRTYVFGRNYGNDSLNIYAGSASLSLLDGISSSVVSLTREGTALLLKIAGDSGSFRVNDFFIDSTSYQSSVSTLQQISFADGVYWNKAQITNRVRASTGVATTGDDAVMGTIGADVIDMLSGNDVVYAADGNDSLNGGLGNDELWGEAGDDGLSGDGGDDLLIGGSGADSYRFSTGSGQDIIQDTEDGVVEDSAVDEIVFDVGISPNDIQLSPGPYVNSVPDLLVTNTVTGDQITVKNFFNAEVGYWGGDHIERIRFADGTTWDLAQIRQKASQVYGTTGADTLSAIGSLGTSMFGLGGDDSLFGGNGDDTLDGGSGNDYMFGGLGNDVFVVDSTLDSVAENPNEGTDTVRSSVAYTLGTNIENLVLLGSANINGTGNSLVNVITGNSGNNTLNGGAGADTLIGGAGNDTYVVDNASDVITENANEGTDLVQSSVTYTLSANVENLTLTGSAALNAVGNALANTLTGNTGNNVLDGGTGADTMIGGTGNDTYMVDNIADVVTEAASAGTDLVQSSVTYTLGSNVENLTLTGTVAINATGNTLANTLVGNNADNILDGGAGNDTMLGGLGNDTYVVDSSSDVVTENANEGTDLVQSSVTYTLSANVENLTLIGATAINGTGNTLANVLTGNSANNTLDGGAGADTLVGGAGNDTYVVDNTSDVITENASEGTDLVQSSVTCTLSANVENLTLTGTSAINATGNALANALTGNSGNNVLDGGAGADTLVGGAGNDTYVVDNIADVVTEAASAGTDLVQSSVTYTLATNVENLTLTGTAAINGTGNTSANILTGNSANNILDGGTGADTMIGGAGNDTYVIDNAGDVVTENANEGTDLVQSSITYTLGSNVENLLLTGTTAINGTGNTLDNILTGNSANNTLTGGAGNDTLDGGAGTDTMVGGTGNDIYYVDATTDVTTEAANEGIDVVNSSVTLTLAANIELLFQSGSTAINGTGNALANLLRGNTANNTLAGAGGTDILEGGAGNDTLSNASGNTLLNGGAGTDTLTGTANNDLLIGGVGNDAITTGQGADIIAFNKGDGQDTVAVSTTKDNTLSIGGGTNYADLLFQKSGNNLILKVGASDQITFTNYYASTSNRSVNTLQVVLEGSTDYNAGSSNAMYNKKVETFDFGGLVAAFDAALVANPSLTSWALSSALAAQYLSGSDTAALGGDLAYQYGRYGNEANLSFTPALGILGSASFGTTAQTLQSLSGLQDASPRLS